MSEDNLSIYFVNIVLKRGALITSKLSLQALACHFPGFIALLVQGLFMLQKLTG